jgi:hypothetical protein
MTAKNSNEKIKKLLNRIALYDADMAQLTASYKAKHPGFDTNISQEFGAEEIVEIFASYKAEQKELGRALQQDFEQIFSTMSGEERVECIIALQKIFEKLK